MSNDALAHLRQLLDPMRIDAELRQFEVMPNVTVATEWEEGDSDLHVSSGTRYTTWSSISPLTQRTVNVVCIETSTGQQSFMWGDRMATCDSFEDAAAAALRWDLEGALRRPDPTPDELAAELAGGVSLAVASIGRDVHKILEMARGLAEMTGRQDARFWNFRAVVPRAFSAQQLPPRQQGETPCYLVGDSSGKGWRTVRLDLFPLRIACYCDQEEGRPKRCENAPPLPIGDPTYRFLGREFQDDGYWSNLPTCEQALEDHQRLLERASMEEDSELRREYEIDAEDALTGDIRCSCSSPQCSNLDQWRVLI